MEKKERGELIRKLVKKRRGKSWRPLIPINSPPENPPECNKCSRIAPYFGFALSFRWGRTKWLEAADEKTELVLGVKRSSKPSPLNKIAEKWQKEPIPKHYAAFSRSLSKRPTTSAKDQT